MRDILPVREKTPAEIHATRRPSRVRRWAARSRLGCLTCRKRRVKCDESSPVCQRCAAVGRCCEWPTSLVQWRPVQLLPAGGYAHALDLLVLIPRTSPGFTIRESIGEELNMTLAISHRMVSYMFELPARAGHSDALDSAVACVAAALRHRRGFNIGDRDLPPQVLHLYGRALKILQGSLNDAGLSCSAETLCATELLCIFEALAGNKVQAYVQHAAGAAKLIKHRGIENFSTEFEKSLLAARLPILIIEAFFRGEHLFLEQEEWLYVLHCCVLSAPMGPDRSEVAISLYQVLTFMPGLLADAKSFMQSSTDDEALQKTLIRRTYELRGRLLRWHNTWGSRLFSRALHAGPVKRILPGEEGQNGKMLDLLCIYEAFFIDCNRLCIALEADHEHALEQQALALATDMTAGQRLGDNDVVQAIAHGVRGNSLQAPIIIACLGVAHVALDTATAWDAAVRLRQSAGTNKTRTVLDPHTFLSWLQQIGFGTQH